jgi:hypothetical protein
LVEHLVDVVPEVSEARQKVRKRRISVAVRRLVAATFPDAFEHLVLDELPDRHVDRCSAAVTTLPVLDHGPRRLRALRMPACVRVVRPG